MSLAAQRRPDGPGPGPIPEGLIRALDLSIRRRVEGVLAGEWPAQALGPGTEIAQIRPYVPGDDVRRIDWSVTARTGVTHVREDVAERAVTTWMALDVSASMRFGTADRRKADVAEGAALALSWLATRRGGRLGVYAFGDGPGRALPPRSGRQGTLGLLTALRRDPAPEDGGTTSLGSELTRMEPLVGRRSLVVCISDLRGPRDFRMPLLRLAGRHDVLVVEVRDPREQELPDVGIVWMRDPETGRQLRVDTSQERLRERFAHAATRERDELASELRAVGADHVVLSTRGDWLQALAAHLIKRRTEPAVAP